MSELEEKLNAVLGDSEAMGQIMALAQSLSAKQGRREESAAPEPPPPPDGQGELAGLLGDVDPQMLQMGMRLLQEYNRSDDRNAALLAALRPFVREERFAKVDRAVRIARLSRVVRVLLDTLRRREDESHV